MTVRTRSVEATRNLVATGCGVSILPEVLFLSWSLDGEQLVAVPVADAPAPLAIGHSESGETVHAEATR